MKTITTKLYVYAVGYKDGTSDIRIDTLNCMESQGWHLIKEFEVSTDIEDLDYSDVIKQKQIEANKKKAELLKAQLEELEA